MKKINNFFKFSLVIYLSLTLLFQNAFAGVTFVQSKDISDQETGNRELAFSSDGTKFFFVGYQGGDVNEYHMTTAFDVSTASFDSSFSVTSQEGYPHGLAFNTNGTKMFVMGYGSDKVHEYALSTGWDVSTASYTDGFDVSSQDIQPRGLAFSTDGTKMFISGAVGNTIEEYTLLDGFDVSTSSHTDTMDVSGYDVHARGVTFNDDGTRMFFHGQQNDEIYDFSLSTAWDLSTNTYNDSISLPSFDTGAEAIVFNNDGTKLFVSGNDDNTIDEYTLSTSFELINTAPTLSSSSPSDGATSVGVDDNIVLTFSEAVDAESGNIVIKKSSDNSTVETIDVTGALVSGSGTTTITINPSTTLDGETDYYVTIAATAFDDVDSADYAGISDATSLNFTTETTNAAPTLSSSSPADGATGFGVSDNIVLTFSEAVDVESGNIVIKKSSDDSTVETIDVTSSLVSGSGTNTITINPSTTLSGDTDYYITIDATAFDDADGASYSGISDSTTLNFTTGKVDPLTDTDVVGIIEAQKEASMRILQDTTTPVLNRMSFLRRYRTESDFTNQNITIQTSNEILDTLSKVVEEDAKETVNDLFNIPDTWSLWSEGSISVGEIGETSSSSAKDIYTNGLTIGWDKKVDNQYLYGYAVQFARDEVDVGTSGSSLDTNTYSVSRYHTYVIDDTKFIDSVIGISSLKRDHVRKSGTNTLTGERYGTQVFGSLNFSTVYKKNDFNITPTGRLDLGFTELSEFSEIGTDALIYYRQKIISRMLSFGVKLDDTIEFNNLKLKPRGFVEYGANLSHASTATMSYVSDPSTDYNLDIAKEETHNARIGIGFDLYPTNRWLVAADYERNQNKNSYSDTLYFGASYFSKREAEYSLSLQNNISYLEYRKRNINGFDLIVSSNYSLVAEKTDYGLGFTVLKNF